MERVALQVIFEEVPPKKFEGIYKVLLGDSLEASINKKFLAKYPIPYYPVVLYLDEPTRLLFKNNISDLSAVSLDAIF